MENLDLQKELFFKKLSEHPILDSFYRHAFEKRCARPGWSTNELVQILVGDFQNNTILIQKRLESIGQCDESLLNAVRGNLTGAEADFDKQSHDQLAELHALECLIKWGYTRITKIPRSSRKTPDFSAFKGDIFCLFEVKNLRLPINLIELIGRALEERHSQDSELYDFSFYVDLPFDGSATVAPSEEDEIEISHFCDDLHTTILSGSHEITWSSTALLGQTTVPKKIRCKWSTSKGYGVRFHSKDFQKVPGKYHVSIDLLAGLERKTSRIIDQASAQLNLYDPENKAVKVILLNWEKPAHFIVDDNLGNQYKSYLAQFNLDLGKKNLRISVMLLD